MLTVAFGESTMSKTRVYEWYKRFKKSREDVEDDDRSGRPSTSITDDNVERVKKMILENRRITIREVADDVGISFGSCQAIFSDVLPPYSPDMVPCDFFLFPKLKRTLKGRRFANINEIKTESLKELNAIPKSEFRKCFED
ncbi:PREDICTED: putative uncharacterized protein FLJ37770 [Trachymyrmex septentrionalis]|uniref:putative uncharacterized protein FLJ37770 n=1 Tax=Trachymyrmex septentrionalis TaxID=34720 RepID=UPI00084EF1EC|nr:PREDICTED: putative uncharacterized protein FLJ37770 [Trachymyrmex septentrionalis]